MRVYLRTEPLTVIYAFYESNVYLFLETTAKIKAILNNDSGKNM